MSALAKRQAISAIEANASALKELSSSIWSHPELAFQEKHAHALLTQFLEERGFQVERQFSLPTAFRAVYGTRQEGGVNVAVICEYDALPGIGHACGHNLIAEAGVAAGLGIQTAIQSSPELHVNSITVLGCPAEEGEGGKIKMIDNGCFDGIDYAMMVHPFTENAVIINALARSYHKAVFTTNSDIPHTVTSDPNTSIPPNALDAAVLAYTSLSLLRQQLNPSWMIHGIISDGGSHPSVSPTSSEILYYLRAPTHTELETLQKKSQKCLESAAMATSCTLLITEKAPTYKDVISNPTLANIFLKNSKELGLKFSKSTSNFSASTDMGNVSYIIPSIHPVYSIGTCCVLHTRDYTDATNSDIAHKSTLLAAQTVAMTGIDIMCNPQLMTQVLSTNISSQTTFEKFT